MEVPCCFPTRKPFDLGTKTLHKSCPWPMEISDLHGITWVKKLLGVFINCSHSSSKNCLVKSSYNKGFGIELMGLRIRSCVEDWTNCVRFRLLHHRLSCDDKLHHLYNIIYKTSVNSILYIDAFIVFCDD